MKQLELINKRKKTKGIKWGRPVSTHTGARRKREDIGKNRPLHITLRLREGLPNHIHLLVEAKDSPTLYHAMKSFISRFAIGIRKWVRSTSSFKISKLGIFRGRYHVEILKTPGQVKNALRYILLNPARHFKKAAYIDAYTSAVAFSQWNQLIGKKFILRNIQLELKKAIAGFFSSSRSYRMDEGQYLAEHIAVLTTSPHVLTERIFKKECVNISIETYK